MMVVRCKGCNSAFAVDDDKIDNKKFAFSCPKCASDNVIDNRVTENASVFVQQPVEMKSSVDIPSDSSIDNSPVMPDSTSTEQEISFSDDDAVSPDSREMTADFEVDELSKDDDLSFDMELEDAETETIIEESPIEESPIEESPIEESPDEEITLDDVGIDDFPQDEELQYQILLSHQAVTLLIIWIYPISKIMEHHLT